MGSSWLDKLRKLRGRPEVAAKPAPLKLSDYFQTEPILPDGYAIVGVDHGVIDPSRTLVKQQNRLVEKTEYNGLFDAALRALALPACGSVIFKLAEGQAIPLAFVDLHDMRADSKYIHEKITLTAFKLDNAFDAYSYSALISNIEDKFLCRAADYLSRYDHAIHLAGYHYHGEEKRDKSDVAAILAGLHSGFCTKWSVLNLKDRPEKYAPSDSKTELTGLEVDKNEILHMIKDTYISAKNYQDGKHRQWDDYVNRDETDFDTRMVGFGKHPKPSVIIGDISYHGLTHLPGTVKDKPDPGRNA